MRRMPLVFLALTCALIMVASTASARKRRNSRAELLKQAYPDKITAAENMQFMEMFKRNRWPAREYETVRDATKQSKKLVDLFVKYRKELDEQKRPFLVPHILPAWSASEEEKHVKLYADTILLKAEEVLAEKKPDFRKLQLLNREMTELFKVWGKEEKRIDRYMELRKDQEHAEIMHSFALSGRNDEKLDRYWQLRSDGYTPDDTMRIMHGLKPKREPGAKDKTKSGKKGDEEAKEEEGEIEVQILKPGEQPTKKALDGDLGGKEEKEEKKEPKKEKKEQAKPDFQFVPLRDKFEKGDESAEPDAANKDIKVTEPKENEDQKKEGEEKDEKEAEEEDKQEDAEENEE